MSQQQHDVIAPITCKNCNLTFSGNFCPNCSQKANTHRLTIPHLGHELLHAFTHTDKGILLLIKKLVRWPGIVAKEYVAGQRKKYFNPITFLLIAMAVHVFVAKKTGFYEAFINESEEFVQNIAKDSTSAKKSVETIEAAREPMIKSMENSKLITFAFLPVLALLTWLLFKKSGFNYAENLVLAVLVQGQAYVFFLVVCIIPFLIYRPSVLIVIYLYTIVVWVYNLLAYRQFFSQRKWVTVLKGSIVKLIYFVFAQQIAKLLVAFL